VKICLNATKTEEYSVENLKLLILEKLIIIFKKINYEKYILFYYLYQPGIDTFNETVSPKKTF
jgi:hypothetical protein